MSDTASAIEDAVCVTLRLAASGNGLLSVSLFSDACSYSSVCRRVSFVRRQRLADLSCEDARFCETLRADIRAVRASVRTVRPPREEAPKVPVPTGGEGALIKLQVRAMKNGC